MPANTLDINDRKYRYRDIDLSMNVHPITGDLSILTDQKAINKSIHNLVLTNLGGRLYKYNLAGNVTGMLFEFFDEATLAVMRNRIEDIIRNYEPRVDLDEVVITPNQDSNQLRVDIKYTSVVAETQVEFKFLLERIT